MTFVTSMVWAEIDSSFLWRYFHTNHPFEDDFQCSDAGDEQEETLVEQCAERVQVDQEEEEDLQEDSGSDTHNTAADHNDKSSKKVSLLFDKMEPFISHFREVSESMIKLELPDNPTLEL